MSIKKKTRNSSLPQLPKHKLRDREEKQENISPVKIQSVWKIAWGVVTGISILLNFYLASFFFVPNISVYFNNDITPEQSLYLPLRITNNGNFSVYGASIMIKYYNIEDINHNIINESISTKHLSSEIKSHDYIDFVDSSYNINKLLKGNLSITISYKSYLFHQPQQTQKKYFSVFIAKGQPPRWLASAY